jgi:hypothetical protein
MLVRDVAYPDVRACRMTTQILSQEAEGIGGSPMGRDAAPLVERSREPVGRASMPDSLRLGYWNRLQIREGNAR